MESGALQLSLARAALQKAEWQTAFSPLGRVSLPDDC